MGSHLGFLIGTISAIFIYTLRRYFLPTFKSIVFLVQKKKRKIYYQDGGHGGLLKFPIGLILAMFDQQVVPILPTKF